MLNEVKKFSVTVLLLALGWIVDLSKNVSEWVSLVLYVVACAFAILAGFSLILKRWPNAINWLPVPDFWLSGRLARREQLSATYFSKQHIRICDLAVDNRIYERLFEDCHIYGPAVVVITGDGIIIQCCLEGSYDNLFMYLADTQKEVIGPIELADCVFRRCHFHGVGFTGPREFLDKIKLSAPIASVDNHE